MRHRIAALPVYAVLLDLWYGLLWNIVQNIDTPKSPAPNLLPTVPEAAFDWLQVAVNAVMVAVMSWALWQLLVLNAAVSRKQTLAASPFRILGWVLTLAFALPALYGLVMSGLHLLQGDVTVSLANPRYFIVAVCIAYCAALCLWRLAGLMRQRKTAVIAVPDAKEE